MYGKKSDQLNDPSSLVNITINKDWLIKLTKKQIIKSSLDEDTTYVDAKGNIVRQKNYIELNRIFINIKDGKIFPTPNHYKGQDIPTNISATVHYQNDYNKVAEYCKKQTVNNLYDFFIAGDNLVRMPQKRETSAQKNKPKFKIQ